MRHYRDVNQVPLKNLCNALNALQSTVYRIEKGSHNYSVDKAIIYAGAVKANIVIIANNQLHILERDTQAIQLLKEFRSAPLRDVAHMTGFSHPGISKMERGEVNLSIDMFLKLAEYYGLTVEIRPQ